MDMTIKKGAMRLKRILRGIRITVLSAILVALCGFLFAYVTEDEQPQNPIPEILPTEFITSYPDKYNVRPIGRTYYEGGVRYFSHSGSGLEFACRGEYATIKLIDDSQGRYLQGHKPRYAIYKDGFIVEEGVLTEGEKICYIALNGYYVDTVLKVVKLSEAQYSAMGVGEITLYGKNKIKPTKEKELKIEFIGDSITCGYGIDEPKENAAFSTATENFTKTYAYLTAEYLNADYSAVCFSGYGVYSGYTSNGTLNDKDTVPLYYDKSCFLYGGRDIQWDFNEFQSDIVVINLGTNDASYCAKSLSGRQEFTRKYADFIRQVRYYNPYAYIICILGDMNNALYSCIEQAVGNYINSGFDHRVTSLTIGYKMGENDIVINGHPGYMSNVYAASELSDKITELIYNDNF